MRGDQPVSPLWLSRDIETSPDGLTMAEIAAKSLFQNLEWAFLFLGTDSACASQHSGLRTQHFFVRSEAISALHHVVRKLMTLPSLPSLDIFRFLPPRSPNLFKALSFGKLVVNYELSAMSYELLSSWNGLFCYEGPKPVVSRKLFQSG